MAVVDLDSIIDSESQIASFPAIVPRIHKAVDDPRGSMDTVGRIITEDPALSARLLKVANSSFYTSPFPVKSISRALTMIGTKQLKDLVTAIYTVKMCSKYARKQIDMDSFWRHSIACGVAARVIATAKRIMNTERFYLAGLLHDVGHLIIYTKLVKHTEELSKRCNLGKEPVYKLERELLGFDHAEVGGRLLKKWQLPDELVGPVMYHHTPSQAPDFQMETAIIHVAEIVASSMLYSSRIETKVPPLDPAAWDLIGTPLSAVPTILEQVKVQFEDAVKMFS
ncbi:MAG: HDOD domain-containing protein [Magnetococcales bacterium]|nr:HDOD domain-containing protein [Magnetococcales bacterium]